MHTTTIDPANQAVPWVEPLAAYLRHNGEDTTPMPAITADTADPRALVAVPEREPRREIADTMRGLPPVDGDQHLTDARALLNHFAIWSGEDALTIATLAGTAMNARDIDGDPIWEYAFKTLVTGDYGAGKSWQSKLISQLVPNSKILLEPTKPALIEEIGNRTTVVVKELDELLSSRGRNRGLVAVMNACYEPGAYHAKVLSGRSTNIHLFAYMLLDGATPIMSPTRQDLRALVSRAIIIRATTAPNGYRRPMWDKVAQATAAGGRALLHRWMATEVAAGMGQSLDQVAKVPESVGDPRRCMLFEPLLTVAQRADAYRSDHYWYNLGVDAATSVESTPEAQAAAQMAADVDEFLTKIRAESRREVAA